ncbi:hypothetical protein GCM10009861_13370 [Neomicrococcus aestuarii]
MTVLRERYFAEDHPVLVPHRTLRHNVVPLSFVSPVAIVTVPVGIIPSDSVELDAAKRRCKFMVVVAYVVVRSATEGESTDASGLAGTAICACAECAAAPPAMVATAPTMIADAAARNLVVAFSDLIMAIGLPSLQLRISAIVFG